MRFSLFLKLPFCALGHVSLLHETTSLSPLLKLGLSLPSITLMSGCGHSNGDPRPAEVEAGLNSSVLRWGDTKGG